MQLISVIVPSYNEEKNIEVLAYQLITIFESLQYRCELIFINDGSFDDTENVLKALCKELPNIYFINLSRNFGQQNALKAGYDYANGQAVICMDSDLQNPPELIRQLISKWEEGFDIVLCKRRGAHQKSGIFKHLTSVIFYKLLKIISDIPIEQHTPDFRLLDRKIVDIIKGLPEGEIFLRGIISWLGFKKIVVQYEHCARIHGQTNYSYGKMFHLAISGLTSFSVRPLHLAIYLGLFISGLSLLYIPYVFLRYFNGHTISGWASLIVVVSFLGGLQLFILGIMGTYIGKIFIQSKKRPEYIVKDTNLNVEQHTKYHFN